LLLDILEQEPVGEVGPFDRDAPQLLFELGGAPCVVYMAVGQ
jgi:hypothetical protein